MTVGIIATISVLLVGIWTAWLFAGFMDKPGRVRTRFALFPVRLHDGERIWRERYEEEFLGWSCGDRVYGRRRIPTAPTGSTTLREMAEQQLEASQIKLCDFDEELAQ